jgi:putative ABC transport system ATP-binding protein
MTPVLQVDRITKTYPGRPPITALRGVSFQAEVGELVAIIGPSGSGKTTLLHLLGTLDQPTTGTVTIDGRHTTSLTDTDLAALRATRIGFVFQQFFLAEHATVLDNVADGLLYTGTGIRARRQQAATALAAVGLADRGEARPTQLSGGQRQRVAIARALIGEPALVLADEPTGNLDSRTGETIMSLLDDLHHRGTTILVVTHDPGIAAWAPRRITLLDGQVIDDSSRTTAHLRSTP